MTFRLTKHQGLGNDFLVLLTDDPSLGDDPAWAARAIRWCHRRTGVGADGLILGGHGAAAADGFDLTMTLYNADGSIAEISGNGLRCLVQAEARRRGEPTGTLRVLTGGGPRTVEYQPGADADTISARADMGPAKDGPTADHDLALDDVDTTDPAVAAALALDATQARLLDVGNPHLVLLVADPAAVDIAAAGPRHEARFDAGMNVHVVAPTAGATDEIDMVIWERGAGVTEACGSGATAVARATHDWGLVGERVRLHMPGGDAVVEVGDPMFLHGPASYIATIEVTA